ncbi:MAG: tRNA adenosine(34) deaminase TadA [Chloracidobacterium sp.]|uniref:tRNA adenosine(34) deaminase TadA n=1 Tax=Chloracidobacterium validum TaxID=2821543 RepID=UPI002484D557|nr:tRNA adenosine(34) deaminase TadA [Chloracidobacterium validum]
MEQTDDITWMRLALAEAQACLERNEVPVGAVLIADNRLVAKAGNRTRTDCDPTAHAEMVVLRDAAHQVGNYRLTGTTLYVTLEPCAMCAGALVQARVQRLVFGATDPKAGAVVSHFRLCTTEILNHRLVVTGGILADACGALLRDFFRQRRGSVVL